MKSTVKHWCKDFGYTWFGPGVHASQRYDYRIIFSKGQSALFCSACGPSLIPQACSTSSGKPFLIFPVYSQLVGQKEMSKAKFIHATAWVKACLAGVICEYGAAEESADPV